MFDSSSQLEYLDVCSIQSIPVLSKHARLYTLILRRLVPPSVLGRNSLVNATLGLPFFHKNIVTALFRICISLCLSNSSNVCKGYNSRAKLTILKSAHLPKSNSGKFNQTSSSPTIFGIRGGQLREQREEGSLPIFMPKYVMRFSFTWKGEDYNQERGGLVLRGRMSLLVKKN